MPSVIRNLSKSSFKGMIKQTLFNILVCKDVFFPRYAEHFLSLIFNYYFLEFVRTLWCRLYHQWGLQTMAGKYFLFSQAIFLRPPLFVNVHVQIKRLTKDVCSLLHLMIGARKMALYMQQGFKCFFLCLYVYICLLSLQTLGKDTICVTCGLNWACPALYANLLLLIRQC